MSESTSPAVELRVRIGPYHDGRMKARPIGSTVTCWVEAFAEGTNQIIDVDGVLSAMVWLPEIADFSSQGQPAEATKTGPGQWRVDVLGDMIGVYTLVPTLILDGSDPVTPILEAGQLQFLITSAGDIQPLPAGGVPYAVVQATATAAAVSAGYASGRLSGAASGAEAGAAAAAPHAEAAAQSKEIALGAADMSREERIAAQAAREDADQRAADALTEAERARQIADTTSATVANAAPQAASKATLATAMAALPVGALGVVYDGDDRGNYRKTGSGEAGLLRESDTLPQVQARVEAVPARAEANIPGWALALLNSDRFIAGGITEDLSGFKLLNAVLETLTDNRVRLRRNDGSTGVEILTDGVALPGLTTRNASIEGLDFLLRDPDGFAIIKRFIEGGTWVDGWTFGVWNGRAEVRGPDGQAVMQARPGGGITLPGGLSISAAEIPGNPPLVYRDSDGFLYLSPDGTSFPQAAGVALTSRVEALEAGVPNTSTFSAPEIRDANTRALAMGSVYRSNMALEIAAADADYNIILVYGQSLAAGQEAWPALTTSVPADMDLYMLGGSEHSVTAVSETWVPIGSEVLTPLRGTVKNTIGGLATDAEVAALAPGSQNIGESPGIAAAVVARQMWLAARGVKSDPSRKWILGNCAISGKTIEELSYGATPHLFNRLVDFTTRIKNLPETAGKSVKVVGVIFLQGEYNYDSQFGGVTDRAGYLAKLEQLRADILSQVCQGVLGQSEPPVWITYQAGAQYTRDATDLSIGRAHLDFAAAHPTSVSGPFPHYHVPDKGGHLDPNGSRWLGCHLGYALGEALAYRRTAPALQPLEALQRGRQVLVSFVGRRAKLAWRDAYVGSGTSLTATMFANKGFVLRDDSGALSVISVNIVADMAVLIEAGRDPVGAVQVRYCGQATFNGSGNLFDDDPTVYPLRYEYTEGSGQYAASNVPELVGKPYPANNPCCAFQITAVPA